MSARILISLSFFLAALPLASAQDYRIREIPAPEGVVLEVGGMDWMPDGSLMMCTRRGEVWNYHPETEAWTRFASGLHEPLGLLSGDKPGEIYVLQRPELSRITDTDGDGVAEKFEIFGQGWGYTGNYHEYAFGLVRDEEGSFYGALGLGFFPGFAPFEPKWCSHGDVPWRGWLFKITKDGEYIPLNPGCREPNSVGRSPDGEIFVTDNQGSYVPSGVLNHAEEGAFLGHPDGLMFDERHPEAASYDIEKLNALRKRPALYLPYREMGASCTAPTWDTTGGKFGPFAGDVLIGDINTPMINRGSLELVDGQYQGAAYHFINDAALGGGSNRLLFDEQGRLWVGQTARGWASGHGLRVIEWSGESALNYEEISLTEDGFQIRWTQAVDPETISRLKISSWVCEYTKNYGSGRLDRRDHAILSASLGEDALTATFVVEGLEADRLVEFQSEGVRTPDGQGLEFPKAWYTLNRLRK
jgi:hypothetical protein